MTDCKYGYATHEKTQRLSLLRSPKGPDEDADMGKYKESLMVCIVGLSFFLKKRSTQV